MSGFKTLHARVTDQVLSVATIGDLPATGAAGDVRYVDSAGTLYVYDGSAWVEVAAGGGGGTGDVSGPASATDRAIARFDGTGGKDIQNSPVTVSDAGAVAGVASINDTSADEIDYLSGVTSPIQTQIDDVAGDISVVASDLDAAETNIASLQTEIDAAEADIATLQTDLSAVVADVASLQSDKLDASEKGAVGGVAELDGAGKVPTSQLPAIALTDVFTVGSQAAQLALTAEEGDVAIRTDLNKSYIHNGGSAGDMTDWSELLTPTDTVLSVNGQTGVVSLTSSNISEGSNLYFTDERAQDAVGAALTDSSSVDFTYNDGAGTITAAVLPAGVDKNSLGGSALSIANGGTGATGKTAAFDSLSPMDDAGQLIYGGTAGTGTKLSAGTSGQWLVSGGAGAPSWTNTVTTPKTIDGSTDAIQLTVQGHSTQTSDIFVVEKSNGEDALYVSGPGATVAGVTSGTVGSSAYRMRVDDSQLGLQLRVGTTSSHFPLRAETTAGAHVASIRSDATLEVGNTSALPGYIEVEAPSASRPSIGLNQNGTAKAIIGVASGTNDIVQGAAAGDLALRTQGGDFWVTCTSGSFMEFKVQGNGQIGVRTGNWGTGGTAVGVSSGVLTTSPSSARYKENVTDLAGEIDTSKIYDLRPVVFTYKVDGKRSFGFIAEEVADLVPSIVHMEDGRPESVAYDHLSVLLLEEIKKLRARIEILEEGAK